MGSSKDVDEFICSTSTYTVGGQRLVADNSTIFFFLDQGKNYSVTVGLNKLSSRGVEVLENGKVSIVGYGTGSSRSAKAVLLRSRPSPMPPAPTTPWSLATTPRPLRTAIRCTPTPWSLKTARPAP